MVFRSTSSTSMSTSPRTVLIASAPPPERAIPGPAENDNASETAAEVALIDAAGSSGLGLLLAAVTARLARDFAPPLIPRTRLVTRSFRVLRARETPIAQLPETEPP